jgi:hypothetical protein
LLRKLGGTNKRKPTDPCDLQQQELLLTTVLQNVQRTHSSFLTGLTTQEYAVLSSEDSPNGFQIPVKAIVHLRTCLRRRCGITAHTVIGIDPHFLVSIVQASAVRR